MVTDVYSEIIDEDRRFNAQKMDTEFYSTLNEEKNPEPVNNELSDNDRLLLELLKSMSSEQKEQLLKQSLHSC